VGAALQGLGKHFNYEAIVIIGVDKCPMLSI
jgi:hypothetical protein